MLTTGQIVFAVGLAGLAASPKPKKTLNQLVEPSVCACNRVVLINFFSSTNVVEDSPRRNPMG